MDFFDTKRDGFTAMKALADSELSDVHINYQMLSNYTRELYENQINQHVATHQKRGYQHQAVSQLGPIRPTQMRAFSTEGGDQEKEKKKGFFSFLEGVNKADEEAERIAKQAAEVDAARQAVEDAKLAKKQAEKDAAAAQKAAEEAAAAAKAAELAAAVAGEQQVEVEEVEAPVDPAILRQ